MRFTIAVSVLAQLVRHVDSDILLPAARSAGRKRALHDFSLKHGGSRAREMLVQRILSQRQQKQNSLDPLKKNREPFDDPNKPSWLSRISTAHEASASDNLEGKGQECDPRNFDNDEPDVGILSCGMNRYCVESADAELGGICVEEENSSQSFSRRMQTYSAYCTTPPPDLTCDCSGFVDGLGPIACSSLAPVCLEDTPSICGIVTYTITYNPDSTYDFGYCAEFTSGVTYDRLCYGYDFLTDGTMGGCYVEIDDVECSSCAVAECTAGNDFEQGGIFDCTNTVANSAGNTCDNDPFLPVLGRAVTDSPVATPDVADTEPPAISSSTPAPIDTPPPTMTEPPVVVPATDPPTAPAGMPATDAPVALPTEGPVAAVETEAPSVASHLATTKIAMATASALAVAFAVSVAV